MGFSHIPSSACYPWTCCSASLSRTCTFLPGGNHSPVSPFPDVHKTEGAHWTPSTSCICPVFQPSQGTFHWTPSCMSASILCCKPRKAHQEGTHHCWGPVKDPSPFLLYWAFQRTTFTQVFVQQTCPVTLPFSTLPFSNLTFWQTSQLMSSGNTPGVLQSNPSSGSLMKAKNFTGSTASLWKILLLTGPHAAITTFWTRQSNQFSMHFMMYIPYISLVWLQGVSGRPCQRPWLNVELPSPLHHCRKQSSWLSTICPSDWAIPNHLVLSMHESDFQEEFFYHLSRNWAVADQHVVSCILSCPLWKSI